METLQYHWELANVSVRNINLGMGGEEELG